MAPTRSVARAMASVPVPVFKTTLVTRTKDADPNVRKIPIAPRRWPAWASSAEIPAQEPADCKPVAKRSITFQRVLATPDTRAIRSTIVPRFLCPVRIHFASSFATDVIG